MSETHTEPDVEGTYDADDPWAEQERAWDAAADDAVAERAERGDPLTYRTPDGRIAEHAAEPAAGPDVHVPTVEPIVEPIVEQHAERPDDDVVDAEVVDEHDSDPVDPAGDARALLPRTALLELRDPDALDALARALRVGLRERVQSLAAMARLRRGSAGKASASWLVSEAQTLAAAAAVLRRLAGELVEGAREAEWTLADAMTDVLGEKRRSAKVADAYGGEIEIRLDPPASRVSVVEPALTEILGAWVVAQAALRPDSEDRYGDEQLVAYGEGVDAGIAALRGVLGASPGWTSTKLAAVVTAMQRAGEGDLAARFEGAYGRTADGDPTPKVKITYPDPEPAAS